MSDIKKVFISYSWDNTNHQDWVRKLAEDLVANGVFVFLDQYDLLAGDDIHHYMEKSIQEADYVLIILTPNYKLRAEKREGGVGYEYSIINQTIFESQKTGRKFIPIIRQGTLRESMPVFIRSLLGIDISPESNYNDALKKILSSIYTDLRDQPPQQGKKPKSLEHIVFSGQHESNISPRGFKEFHHENTPIFSGLTGPLVMFHGPAEVGKTMALMRLVNYLQTNYSIVPMKGFRQDDRYSDSINLFFDQIRLSERPLSTGYSDYVLINLQQHGNTICQFLDYSGEHFHSNNDRDVFPPYVQKILNSTYRKVHVLFFDLSQKINNDYFNTLISFTESYVNPKLDRLVFLISKADLNPELFIKGKPNQSYFKQKLNGLIGFRQFATRLKKVHNTTPQLVCFSSGHIVGRNNQHWTFSPDYHPKQLWSTLSKELKGGNGVMKLLGL